MDIATILSTALLIPLGLAIGWALTGKKLPEVVIPEAETTVPEVETTPEPGAAATKQKIHKILTAAGIHPTVNMTKPKLKTALSKLIKADILFLAENHYGFTVNKNLAKPIMIDAFINQMSAKEKEDKKV